MHRLARPPLPTPAPRQLTLPLAAPEALPSTTLTAAPAITMTPQQVWTTLSPTAQVRLRQTVLRVLLEVMHVAPEL